MLWWRELWTNINLRFSLLIQSFFKIIWYTLFVWYVRSSYTVWSLFMTIRTYVEAFVSYVVELYKYSGSYLYLLDCESKYFLLSWSFFHIIKFFIMSYLPYIFFFNWKYLVPDTFCLITTKLFFVHLMPFLIDLQVPEFIDFIKASLGYWIFGYLIWFLYLFSLILLKFALIIFFKFTNIFLNQIHFWIKIFWTWSDLYSFWTMSNFYIHALYDIYNDLCYTFCPDFIVPNFYFTLHIVFVILCDFEKFLWLIMLIYFLVIHVYYIWIYFTC